jgi:hypothetical protein
MRVRCPARVLRSLGLASAVLFLCAQCEVHRRPCHYLIPEGYVGWFQIDFGANGSPSLPIEDGCYVLKIPPTGELYARRRSPRTASLWIVVTTTPAVISER